MSTKPPMCKFCGHAHPQGAPHILGNPKAKPKNVPTLKKNAAKIIRRPKNVPTIRQVSIRELSQGISKHFSDLPFEVTKSGKVIARVDGLNIK